MMSVGIHILWQEAMFFTAPLMIYNLSSGQIVTQEERV